MHTKGDRMVKRGTIRLGEEGIRNTRIKWSEDMDHKRKPHNDSDTCGGAFERRGDEGK